VDTLLIGGLIYLVETPDVGCRRWWGCPPSLSPYLSVSGRRRHGPRCCAVDAGTQTYSHLLTHRAIGIQVDAATSSVAPSWSGLVDATAVHTGHPPSELLTHHRHWRFSRRTHHTHCRVSTLNHSLCCCRHWHHHRHRYGYLTPLSDPREVFLPRSPGSAGSAATRSPTHWSSRSLSTYTLHLGSGLLSTLYSLALLNSFLSLLTITLARPSRPVGYPLCRRLNRTSTPFIPTRCGA